MANPNFIPDFSTNQIFRDLDQSRCLTDDLDDMDDAIGALDSGKADLEHTHTGYAAATHGHTDYAPVSHEHSGYANSNHTHTGFAAANHTHDYADASHNHSYNDLTDKPTIPAAYTHPASHPATMIDGLAGVATSGSYNDLSDKPTIPTVPASLPANGGNADTVDGKHADDFAATSHTHTDYAAADHAHAAYASAEHTHTVFPSDATTASYKLVYISTTGNDDNDGFTQANAMATIKGVIKKYADTYNALDIRLLDGTYTEDTWDISVDQSNLSIRGVSENKDACILNIAANIETNVNKLRMYNMTVNVTATNVRAVSVTAGSFYAYNVRFNVPTDTDASCVNVYNGSEAFLMNCVLNSGTGSSAGAAVYGNQAMLVKAINCTSERKVNIGVHAHNGSDIQYTNTINATTAAKETYYGKCTVRS